MTDDAPTDNTDAQPPVTDGAHHLTYGQIGERLGMSADAARQLVRRKGWRRSRPNAIGQPVVVAVPASELINEHNRPPTDDEPSVNRRASEGTPTGYRSPPLENGANPDGDDRWSILSVTVGALRSAVDLLGQQFEAEHRRADAAQTQIEELHRDLTAAEIAASEARAALDAARQQATDAQAAAEAAHHAQVAAETEAGVLQADVEAAHQLVTAAQDEAEQLWQAEVDRKGRRRWARLRAAWRGE
jgi:hypothetical protein